MELTFPDQIEGLQRMPTASPSPSTGEVDISYASEGATRIRFTLTPLPEGTEPDLQGALMERARSRTASSPTRYEPALVIPVLCNSEEVGFAYEGIKRLTPSGIEEPIPCHYSSDTHPVVTSDGRIVQAHGDCIDLEPLRRMKLGWRFAAGLSGHLVVIESQISRHAELDYRAAPALRDLLEGLGWPCRLAPKPEPSVPMAEPKFPRRTAPIRDLQQSAGIPMAREAPVQQSASIPARAAPVDAFGESSTLGPRPVHRDSAPGTYAHARSTGRPHSCETSAPTFFGEREEYVAYVEGDDFYAPGRDIHFARVNGVAYAWSDEPLNEEVVLLGRIRLRAYEDAYQRLMHHIPPRWEDSWTFVEPADDDRCTPAEPQQITLPGRELRDVTEVVIARQRQYFEAWVETLKKLPFTPRLPHPALIALFPATRGYAGSEGYSVQYLAHGAGPQGESSELSIGFQAHTSDEPASQCGESWIGRRVCEHVATTHRGLEVFRELRVLGGSSNLRLPQYYAKVGDALVNLKYIYWSHGPSGATGWRAHEFAPGELEAVFESLQPVDAEAIVRFPGMSVSQ